MFHTNGSVLYILQRNSKEHKLWTLQLVFESWFCGIMAVWLWASYLTSLDLNFLITETGMLIVPTTYNLIIKVINRCGGFRTVKVAQSCLTFLQPHELYSPWNSPGQNTGVGRCSLLQGIFPTQGWNPDLPYCRGLLYQLRVPAI